MNMGDDSRLMYDEIGERMEVAKPDLVDYFPFPDPRDERIRVLEEALQPFASIGQIITWPDTYVILRGGKHLLTAGDLKRAADALAVGPVVTMVYVREEGES